MINLHHQVFGRKYGGIATVGNNSTGFIGFISTRNGNVSVDWGDGAINNITTLKNVDFTNYPEGSVNGQIAHTYSSASIRDIKINLLNGFNDMYSLRFSSYYGSYDNMLYILDWGVFIKQFTNLYSFYYNVGNNTQTIKGDLSQIPNSLERIYIENITLQNNTDLYLNLSNFSSASQLKYFSSVFSPSKSFKNIYGDLSKLPPLINYFLLAQNLANTLTYTAGRTWASSFDTLDIGNATLSATETDNLFNDMANSITTAIGSKIIRLVNCYRTPASNPAVAYLQSLGYVITVAGIVLDTSTFVYSEISGTNGYLPLQQSGALTFTTDRKGGNTAIQLGSGDLKTINNLPLSKSWSFSFWIKTTDASSLRYFIAFNLVTAGNRELGILIENGKIRAEINNAGQAYLNVGTAPTIINNNNWHHVVVIFDSTQSASNEIKIWIDNIAQTLTKSYNSDTSGNFINKGLIFGRASSNFNYFNGALDDLKIYNRPPTQTEITNLYNE